MKTYGKVILIIAAALMIAPTMAMAAASTDPAAAAPAAAAKHPLADIPAFQEEKARHEAAVEAIRAPLKEIRQAMAAEIKALREQYFPKPAEGEKRTPPDPAKLQEFRAKVREIVAKYQTQNEAALKDIAGKLFDERILHRQNILQIVQANKDTIVNAHWRKLLVPRKVLRNIRERIMRMRMMHAGVAAPSTVPGP